MEYKKAIKCGGISGLVAGIFATTIGVLLSIVGMMGIANSVSLKESNMIIGSITVPIFVLYGIFLGICYSFVRPVVPGEGLKKGLYYGLLIWMIADVSKAAFMYVMSAAMGGAMGLLAMDMVLIGCLTKIVFGLTLESLWRKEEKG